MLGLKVEKADADALFDEFDGDGARRGRGDLGRPKGVTEVRDG